MRYLGRESSEISREAHQVMAQTGDEAARGRTGLDAKTLWQHLPDPAVLEAETQLTYRPDDLQALRFLAGHALSSREWGRAIILLRRVTSLAPTDWDAHRHLAEALLLDERSSEAVVVLGHLLSEVGDDPIAHYNMALAMGLSGGDVSHLRLHAEACELLTTDDRLRRSANQLVLHFSEAGH